MTLRRRPTINESVETPGLPVMCAKARHPCLQFERDSRSRIGGPARIITVGAALPIRSGYCWASPKCP
jgi:hypothetical protein